MKKEVILSRYRIYSEGTPADVVIYRDFSKFVDSYELTHVHFKEATKRVMAYLKEKIVSGINVKLSELLDRRKSEEIKKRLKESAHKIVSEEFPSLSGHEESLIVGKLIQEMLGLGTLEFLLSDPNLEEIVVNSYKEPIRVYHKEFGWLNTNVFIKSEEQIRNYASIIGRKVGRQITNLRPLMDAHLISGSRVNATLFPISTKGHGFTIRQFAKEPWTMVHFISPKLNTLNSEAASLFWLCMQYELSILVGGGTASGKTSFLNTMLAFIPPNQRIVSIEDTREIVLPQFLNWTPLTTRLPNPEGEGGVTMLDLLVNSLRMRPDRIVVGEVRRKEEAEVLFEAMHTGHAVYATIHADDALRVVTRLTSPPINLDEGMLGALQLIDVQYRQRRTGIRRTYEIAEVIPSEGGIDLNILYKWDARADKLLKVGTSVRLVENLTMHTGMTKRELSKDLKDKQLILEEMQKESITKVDDIGKIVAAYYREPDYVIEMTNKSKLKKMIGEYL